ncbi:MAG: hypothetical protein CBB97_21870 [Candidatus Endolissoclinum sp. TMED37]|nr:MAG: hypothetical protein CBB97_21870 [Candidatus Endolissoclinum sp. TMED37]|tara:strand:- start:2720 stop:3316 length:597 start_codon:yes stop_codon:yes gene_type:complete
MVVLTYGEITEKGIEVFDKYLTKKSQYNNHFLDLGSGKGKSLIYFHNRYPEINSITGIEYMKERHNAAVELIKKTFIDAPEETSEKEYHYGKFHLYCGNFFDKRFSDIIQKATLIYVSNLLNSKKTNDKISKMVQDNTGAVVVSSLPLSKIHTKKTVLNQSWASKGQGHIWTIGGKCKTRKASMSRSRVHSIKQNYKK